MHRFASIRARVPVAAAAAVALVALSGSAGGAVIVNISPVGSDLSVSGSGSYASLGAFSAASTVGGSQVIIPSAATLLVNQPNGNNIQRHDVTSMTGPSTFGTGGTSTVTSVTGDIFGIQFGTNKRIFVPVGYTAGSPIAGSGTVSGASLASLGLTAGSSYTWSWGSGGTADSFTINVVPEPAALSVLGIGAVGLLARRRRGRAAG